tara:strand:- start:8099 stop:8374 length:276 start_codon:yes stop_codon:yes gene_type:complete
MQVVGTIKVYGEVQTFGNNGFKKREIVVKTDEDYPQMLLIEFTQDKTSLLDQFQIGSKVTISINLKGNEWINPQGVAKYFIALNGWRIEQA